MASRSKLDKLKPVVSAILAVLRIMNSGCCGKLMLKPKPVRLKAAATRVLERKNCCGMLLSSNHPTNRVPMIKLAKTADCAQAN